MLCDVTAGVTPQDIDIAGMLMRSGKPVVLAVSKCDSVGEPPMELYDFYSLGIGELYPVSGVHGHGTGDLLDAVCDHLDFSDEQLEDDERISRGGHRAAQCGQVQPGEPDSGRGPHDRRQ